MKRRNLIKSGIVSGIAASATGRSLLPAVAPALGEVSATTWAGSEALLSKFAVSGLQSALNGTLLQSHSPGYDAARTLCNTMIDKHPALIAQCISAGDVATAVRFGQEHQLTTVVCADSDTGVAGFAGPSTRVSDRRRFSSGSTAGFPGPRTCRPH